MTEPSSAPTDLREADSLLAGINRSIFFKALILSTIVHLLFMGISSFSLYKDWAEYGVRSGTHGFHTPSVIKTIKRENVQAEQEAARNQKLEERIAAQRAEAQAAAANATPTPVPETSMSPTEEPTVEPLPPKQNFSLDDLPGLGL